MNQKLFTQAREYVKVYFTKHHNSNFVFHDFTHTESVVQSVCLLSNLAKINQKQILYLSIAALFHDMGYTEDPYNHESKSVDIAEQYLLSQNVSILNISIIKQLIYATKLNWKGSDYNSLLLRDADLAHLAAESFLEISNKLRKEYNFLKGEKITSMEWNHRNIEFLEAHEYHTKEGRILYNSKKMKNLNKLKDL